MKYISVCIPTYEMNGLGATFLKESFDMFVRQTFTDFEIIISDHSEDTAIEDLCRAYTTLDIHYIRNQQNRGNSSANLNNAIKNAQGKLIKILFQDDFLYHDRALEEIVANFNLTKDTWLVTTCEHSRDGKNFVRPFHPHYNHRIHLGKNTLSSPSVLTIKNDAPILFDETLIWLMDCDYYRRCYDTWGAPKILDSINVVNRIGEHQVTKKLATRTRRHSERRMMIKKFGRKPGPLSLPHVTLVAVSSVKINETIHALEKSKRGIKFGKVIFLTDASVALKDRGIDVIHIERLGYDDYSKFILYRLKDYVQTDFALIVQHDGYVLRPRAWRDVFLEYDYIGAPWARGLYRTEDGTPVRVGNGGFSLRSKQLLEAPTALAIPFTDQGTGFFHEDGIICLFYRTLLERNGIRFAPVDVASDFSRERFLPDSSWFPFGFHSNRRNIFSYLYRKLKHYL